MNTRGGFALISGLWLSWLQYRSFFFLLAFGWMIPSLIYLLVWYTAAGEGAIGGMNRAAFATYYLVLILVNQLTYAQTNWTVGDLIRYGGLNRILLRPVPPLFDTLASEFAAKTVYLLFDLPIVFGLAVLLKPDLSFELQDILAFLPALALAWGLRFFWGYWLALLAFWAARADALLSLQDSLIFLLSGQIAPIAFLPQPLQFAALLLPFRYMSAYPVELLTGQLDGPQITLGFGIQIFWFLLAVALYAFLWRRGLRRYTAIGG